MSELLWTPSPERVERANLTAFMAMVNAKRRKALATYGELYQWSIERPVEFWADIWKYGGVIHHQPYAQAVTGLDKMPGARWFTGSTLNFAENLLRRRDDHPALVFNGEWQVRRTLTYAELYDQVARLARSLKSLGVTAGDRVAGFMPNMPEAIIGMLAAASLGAVWSSCSPDFGFQGVMDRFGQIQPKLLITADGYFYNGKTFDCLAKIGRAHV
jgi:acetoacetyl-CoA synthetase